MPVKKSPFESFINAAERFSLAFGEASPSSILPSSTGRKAFAWEWIDEMNEYHYKVDVDSIAPSAACAFLKAAEKVKETCKMAGISRDLNITTDRLERLKELRKIALEAA